MSKKWGGGGGGGGSTPPSPTPVHMCVIFCGDLCGIASNDHVSLYVKCILWRGFVRGGTVCIMTLLSLILGIHWQKAMKMDSGRELA